MRLVPKDLIVDEVCDCIVYAKTKIYATHNFLQDEDAGLPTKYQEAIVKSQVGEYKRLCFGDEVIVKQFIDTERNQGSKFDNRYVNYIYQRMILIDGFLFFKVTDQFFCTEDQGIVSVFESWFLSCLV